MWCIVDEFSRVRPAVRITRELKAGDVIEALCEQVVSPDIRAHIRSAEAAIQANHNQRIARSAPAIATSVSRLADMVGSFGQRPVAGRIRRAHPRTKFVVLEGAVREPHISRCRVGEIPCERRMSEEIGLRRRQPLRAIFSGISQRLTKSPLMADFCGRRTSLKMARAGLSRGIQRKRKHTREESPASVDPVGFGIGAAGIPKYHPGAGTPTAVGKKPARVNDRNADGYRDS